MNQKEFNEKIENTHVSWTCRFHPVNYWHEVGCPHREWTNEDLLKALIQKKKFEQSGLKGTVLTGE